MKAFSRAWSAWGVATVTSVLLAGCGGGGGDGTPTSTEAGITTVKVVGDSLNDSGVFGVKFAMQGTAAEPMRIWTERIAAQYGTPALCPRYVATNATTVVPNPSTAACTSYAVGGGRINLPAAPASPLSIPQQLTTLAAEKAYTPGDLLLIGGGGNDAADLVGAYLKAPFDRAADYSGLLASLIGPAATGTQLAAGPAGAANAGGLYMTALANKMADAVRTSALERGARKVVLLNLPGINNTPRFQSTLDLVALGSGGGVAGATARAQTEAVIKSWIEAYNRQLASRFAGNANVLVVDFYSNFNDQIANPAQYGLTNVKTPACPAIGRGSDNLPEYNTATCTFASLSAQTPPPGSNGQADWWRSYAFSDGFHPTAYGYQLMAQMVTRSLATAGWL